MTIADLVAANAWPRAEFAYIDDSGDPGMKPGSSSTFGLGCVLVPMDHWTARLDLLVEARRELRQLYGFRMGDELKGEWLAGVKKRVRELGLGDGQLRDIYRRQLQLAPIVTSGSFAVIFQKLNIRKSDMDLNYWAWEYLLQRLRLRTLDTKAPIVIIHDNGSRNDAIRTHLRAYRRIGWVGGRTTEAPLLIEDPVARDSQHSYFIQLADLAAFAASRRVLPSKGKRANICPPDMWQNLGTARLTAVSSRGDGIVAWP